MRKNGKFRKSVFANGLTLVTERQHSLQSLSIGVWVKTGTRHESVSEAGASHFLEHMLFKGTKNRSALEIARAVDRVGGEFNAFTAREHTCFHLLLLNRDSDLGIEILSDVLLNSTFDSEEMERERNVILQEISMVEESPEELLHDIFFELIYGNHGLGKPILGTQKSIRAMKRAEMMRYFKRNYRPDQLIVAVAGDVSHERVVEKLKTLKSKHWSGRPEKKITRKNIYGMPGELKSGFWWIERPSEQVHLVWGVQGPHYASKDRFAAFLLNVYLGGGMSSSLFQEIREKNGLAYSVYSNLTPFQDSGVFSIYAATGMAQVPLCLKLIEECVEKLRNELLSKDELEAVKDNLKGTILLSSDSVESRMASIAKNELYFGAYVSPEEVCREIDRVNRDDVRRMAEELLGSGKRSIAALGPKPSRAIVTRFQPEVPRRYCRT